MTISTQNQAKKRKTSKSKAAKPYWNENAAHFSQQWGLNTMLPTAAKKLGQKINSDSWFSVIKHPQAPIINDSLNLPLSSGVEEELIRARKIRIYPTNSQKETLKKWFGCHRYIYNKALKMHKDGVLMNIKILREKLLNKKTSALTPEEQWLSEYNYDLKDEALRDLVKNYSSNMAKFKKTRVPFKLRFKTKKAPVQTLSVLKKYWNKGKKTFYSDIYSSFSLRGAEPLPEELPRDSRLQRTRNNKYYLIVPMAGGEIARKPPTEKFIFIDPGVRTFLTGYDSSQTVVEIGKDAIVRIEKLKRRRRQLQSKLAKLRKHKKRQNHRKALHRLDEKISHIVQDLHKKSALFLCKSYDSIFLPKLNFHHCTKLNRKSRSSMATLAHCSFHDRLTMKAEQFHDASVHEVEEDYTSKTCSTCGKIKNDLRSNKIYSCLGCFSVFDRDFNAAKNIMLKYICEHLMASGGSSISSSLSGGNGRLAMMGPGPFVRKYVVSPSEI
ncbi:RNA-guided endonuclease InsQ/TnpB family protein TDEL_0C00190 [Torulaspora delbrueckii]|uniref:Transposase putative helix-turn-helix domain-containing protein n=1 Tax=Torulaspora delbrueckii TaxID=4950 RepID=G8ZQW6_TORDE|nr:hypothetical protein TDEL_0C00190 [Torulaspora delbrueckii]CCE90908.1 hypothetical protein TDEL_0C00190 [Torulaspora delbrueckii]